MPRRTPEPCCRCRPRRRGSGTRSNSRGRAPPTASPSTWTSWAGWTWPRSSGPCGGCWPRPTLCGSASRTPPTGRARPCCRSMRSRPRRCRSWTCRVRQTRRPRRSSGCGPRRARPSTRCGARCSATHWSGWHPAGTSSGTARITWRSTGTAACCSSAGSPRCTRRSSTEHRTATASVRWRRRSTRRPPIVRPVPVTRTVACGRSCWRAGPGPARCPATWQARARWAGRSSATRSRCHPRTPPRSPVSPSGCAPPRRW